MGNSPGDCGDARAPPKMATGSSHPVANWHGGTLRDFSQVGGAAFPTWLVQYLGPLLTAVGNDKNRASDPATLQYELPGTELLRDQARYRAAQLAISHLPMALALPHSDGTQTSCLAPVSGGRVVASQAAGAYHRCKGSFSRHHRSR